MNALLDTSTFIWLTQTPEQLPDNVIQLCQNPENTLYLSSLSSAEIAMKYARKKLSLPSHPSIYIPEERMEHDILPLPLDETSAFLLESLPLIHKDPFDRLLICQALAHDLIILTPDRNIRQYKVKTMW